MNVKPIETNQSFEGNVVVKGRISTQQNYLFSLHKPVLEMMIKDLPFDMFIEQSKSKKTISLSTNVEGVFSYFVRKNKQNFEEMATLLIDESKKKSEIYKKQVKAEEIFEYEKAFWINVLMGKFKEAKKLQQDLAKLAINDFEIYKAVTNFEITNFPKEVNKILFFNSIKYNIYRAFTSKSPEEKELKRMNKKYLKDMRIQNKKIEPKIIDYSKFQMYY